MGWEYGVAKSTALRRARRVLSEETREENQIKDDPKRPAAPRAVRPQPILANGILRPMTHP